MPDAWATSTRKYRLPRDWHKIRARILKLDGYRCCWVEAGQRCTARATDVDHVVRGDDHRDENLQSLCVPHHRRKTAAEIPRAKRPPEKHPGLLW